MALLSAVTADINVHECKARVARVLKIGQHVDVNKIVSYNESPNFNCLVI